MLTSISVLFADLFCLTRILNDTQNVNIPPTKEIDECVRSSTDVIYFCRCDVCIYHSLNASFHTMYIVSVNYIEKKRILGRKLKTKYFLNHPSLHHYS